MVLYRGFGVMQLWSDFGTVGTMPLWSDGGARQTLIGCKSALRALLTNILVMSGCHRGFAQGPSPISMSTVHSSASLQYKLMP